MSTNEITVHCRLNTHIQAPYMSHWFLNCSSCQKPFIHSPIATTRADTLDPFWPAKPDFPAGGSNVECPHCHQSALYQRYQLMFHAA